MAKRGIAVRETVDARVVKIGAAGLRLRKLAETFLCQAEKKVQITVFRTCLDRTQAETAGLLVIAFSRMRPSHAGPWPGGPFVNRLKSAT